MTDIAANQTAQDEEIESLQSIYLPEELIVSQREDGRTEILAMVAVLVPDEFKINYLSEKEGIPCAVPVQHLPPIQLKITYKKYYPSTAPPHLNISCVWLSPVEIRKLHSHLISAWVQNPGFPIVYNWIEILRAEALEIAGKLNGINFIPSATNELVGNSSESGHEAAGTSYANRRYKTPRKTRPIINVVPFLEAFNAEKIKDDFLKSYIQCEICFADKLGTDSIQFSPCRHTFCRECLKGYFTVLVKDGSSAAIRCPAYKCETEATQTQVREVLPQELFDRYDRALLSTTLDTMSDIVYCPRPLCNYPVTWEAEEKVAICPNCGYAFCIYCRMVYHGIEPCRLNADARRTLVENYQTASAEERADLEARYGKKQINNLVSNTLSEYWIKDNSKHCPKCNIVIEKTDGCNKMTCFRCQAYFCWLCGAHLDPKAPYLHFQNPKSKCNNKLFLFGEGEADDWELEEWVGDDSDLEDMEGDTDTESELDPI